MFELLELSIGYFAIVEKDVDTSKYPFIVHGFISVKNSKHFPSYHAVLTDERCSDELAQSGELPKLKKLAEVITEEAVADEFGD